MNNEKRIIRRQMLEQRRAEDPAVIYACSEAMQNEILQSDLWKQADTVMGYMALPGEISIEKVLQTSLDAGKRVFLPRCEGDNLVMAEVSDLHQVSPGTWGILEPTGETAEESPDLVLTPGLAFSPNGVRLGFGKGYYDRFFSSHDSVKVGICPESWLRDELPHSRNDINMDYVLTENCLRPCARE